LPNKTDYAYRNKPLMTVCVGGGGGWVVGYSLSDKQHDR